MNKQHEALLRAVTQALGPDGDGAHFDAATWARIHAAITHTLALNAELLEALIDAERICSEVAAHLGLSYSDAEGIAKNARAAIAKAEGRA